MALCAFALPCFSQQASQWDRWDSLCITHPPCKDNHIDSTQLEFYRNFYETLTPEESKILMYRYDSLIHNAKDWQWSDSAFLKSTRCFMCMQSLFYDFYIQKNTEEIIKHYESLKDTVLVTIIRANRVNYSLKDIEIPFESSKAEIYCLYYPSDFQFTSDFQKNPQTVEWQGLERVKLVKNGFLHPGNKEGNNSFFILKYANIYYKLGSISSGGDVTLTVINSQPLATLKVEPAQIDIQYNKWMPRVRGFSDSYDKLKRYSKENKLILRNAMKQSPQKESFKSIH